VWKVSLLANGYVKLQQATDRDGRFTQSTLAEFVASCEPYFAGGARIVDQAFQPRIVEGMVRCYMSAGELVGFWPSISIRAGGRGSRHVRSSGGEDDVWCNGIHFARLRSTLENEWCRR